MTIARAVELIATFDPAAAKVFAERPFSRHTLVTALHRSLSTSYLAPMADEIAVALRSATDAAARISREG